MSKAIEGVKLSKEKCNCQEQNYKSSVQISNVSFIEITAFITQKKFFFL